MPDVLDPRATPAASARSLLRVLVVTAATAMGCASAEGGRPSSVPAPASVRAAGTCIAAPARSARPSRLALAVLGSGGPRSFGRAASGYVLFVDGVARALVDVGPGAFVRLGEMGVDLHRLDTVLLTHLHIDHAGDLPAFVKSRDLTYDEPLDFRIFGPNGAGAYPSTTAFVDRLFGAHGAFAYLPKFRNTLSLNTVDLPIAPDAPIREVLRDGDLRVTSTAVDHDDVPAVAFRVAYAGRAIVVSGDLASKNDNLTRLAEGADLLVYDTAVLDPPGSPDKLYDLHTPPSRIGEVAASAHVKSLLLSHLPPPVEKAEDAVLRSVRTAFAGPARFATDCMRVDMD